MVTPRDMAPEFVEHPASQETELLSTFVLSVKVRAVPVATYQWYLNGEAIEGAESAEHEVGPLREPEVGEYTCVATNAVGESTSNVGLVTLSAIPPEFVAVPEAQEVDLGDSLALHVEVTGTPTPTLQWFMNDATIPEATGASLRIKEWESAEPRTYECVARNSAGKASSGNIVVTPRDMAPEFVEHPQEMQELEPGQPLVVAAVARGVPVPTYQWHLNSTAIDGAVSSTYEVSAALPAHFGKYTCVATNSVGEATCRAAMVEGKKGPLDPFLVRRNMWSMVIGWKPWPASAGTVVKHTITALYIEVDDAVAEDFEVAGGVFEYMMDAYHELPIDPEEEFRFSVKATLEDGSEVQCSSPVVTATLVSGGRTWSVARARVCVCVCLRFPSVCVCVCWLACSRRLAARVCWAAGSRGCSSSARFCLTPTRTPSKRAATRTCRR